MTREALAGVTLLAIATPLNIGCAPIAGLPPTAGLYAFVIPAVLSALTVSSRQVVASPDAAAAALVASSLGGLAVALGEGLLASRSYGQKRGYRTRPNRDLFAFGAANMGAGLTGGFTVGSSTSRTAAMDQAGSRTQLPTLVTAAGTLVLLTFGTGLLEDIPSTAVEAIVAVAVVPLLGIPDFIRLWQLDRFDFAIDTLAADGDPDHSLLEPAPPGEPTAPGVVVVRLAAPLLFANATVFEQAVERAIAGEGVHHLVLDMEAVTDVDVTGADAWETIQGHLADHRVTLALSRVRAPVADRLRHLGLLRDVTVFRTNREALSALTDEGGRRG